MLVLESRLGRPLGVLVLADLLVPLRQDRLLRVPLVDQRRELLGLLLHERVEGFDLSLGSFRLPHHLCQN